MWIRRPLCILTHKYQCTDLSIDKTPLIFKKKLENLRDRPIIWIRAEDTSFNESANAYSRDKNYQALLDSMQSSHKHSYSISKALIASLVNHFQGGNTYEKQRYQQ